MRSHAKKTAALTEGANISSQAWGGRRANLRRLPLDWTHYRALIVPIDLEPLRHARLRTRTPWVLRVAPPPAFHTPFPCSLKHRRSGRCGMLGSSRWLVGAGKVATWAVPHAMRNLASSSVNV